MKLVTEVGLKDFGIPNVELFFVADLSSLLKLVGHNTSYNYNLSSHSRLSSISSETEPFKKYIESTKELLQQKVTKPSKKRPKMRKRKQ